MAMLRRILAGGGVLAILATAGCATQQKERAGGEFPRKALRIMAPAAPGGGWDQTSRELQSVLRAQTRKPVEVYNVGGAGGTVGLAQYVGKRGDPYELMTMGLIMAGAVETNRSKVRLDQVTPLARLTADYEVIVVPAKSPYRDMRALADAMRDDIGAVSIAGGSAGGVEQILAGMVAKAIGADPGKVNYIAHSGGGEALTTILSGRSKAGISGISEISEQIEAGKVRALAVSAPRRMPGIDAPTLRESGINVELANWRGIVAPPGITKEDEAALEKMLTDMARSPQWQAVLKRRGWQDNFLAGEPFERFMATEQTRVRGVLDELGLI
ncbi:MAG TPA: tripartite tricarboxylate transporter substrate-binding protein [Streptosporangiaceae bacterium]|nr:tripartite tricarboxylate transporter substrate-binding protein [Streptosporangiaceae bacterium]